MAKHQRQLLCLLISIMVMLAMMFLANLKLLHPARSSSQGPSCTARPLTTVANAGSTASNGIVIFAGVLSASVNHERRDAVRATWGSDPRLARVVFLLARPKDAAVLDAVHKEAMHYNDIVLLGHVEEHYFNVTYQTLEVMRAAHMFHAPVTHVLKADDDTFVHVARLLTFLALQPRNWSFAGHINSGYKPLRNPKSKWHVSSAEIAQDRLNISWANGPAYVLSADIASELATGAVSQCMPGALFRLEDIAMGMWLACLARQHNRTLSLGHDGRFNPGGCSPGAITAHYIQPQQMRCMFASAGACC